ncbi:MAG: hypothetical protein AAFY57_10485 [Cyanobacteria bacterium J06642_2]
MFHSFDSFSIPAGYVVPFEAQPDVNGFLSERVDSSSLAVPPGSIGFINMIHFIHGDTDTTLLPKIVRDCRVGNIQTASSFIDVGRGGLPPGPAQLLSGSAVWEDLRAPATTASLAIITQVEPESPPRPIQPAIVEAQGWIVNETGDIVLVTDAPNAIATVDGFSKSTCREFATEK